MHCAATETATRTKLQLKDGHDRVTCTYGKAWEQDVGFFWGGGSCPSALRSYVPVCGLAINAFRNLLRLIRLASRTHTVIFMQQEIQYMLIKHCSEYNKIVYTVLETLMQFYH